MYDELLTDSLSEQVSRLHIFALENKRYTLYPKIASASVVWVSIKHQPLVDARI